MAAVVLAAGAGRRYGGPRALVCLDGRLLVERPAATAVGAGCGPVVVVLGAAAGLVRQRARLDGAVTVENPDWATGMGSSLRTGLGAVAGTAAVAAVVLLVDMPGITPEAVRRVSRLAAPGVLAMGGYGTRRGHPVLGRDHWAGESGGPAPVTTVGAPPVARGRSPRRPQGPAAVAIRSSERCGASLGGTGRNPNISTFAVSPRLRRRGRPRHPH